METDIKPGDLVYLALAVATPAMTATDVRANGDVVCRWFDQIGQLNERTFHASELRGTSLVDVPPEEAGENGGETVHPKRSHHKKATEEA